MIDIPTQSEVILREAGYETWPWSGSSLPAVCFENETLVGFIHVFPTTTALQESWQQAQQIALSRYAPALRAAQSKAWNVYSVFLTPEMSSTLERRIERIEEDFSLARKIARAGIQTVADLTRAVLPLLPIRSQPVITSADYTARLRARLGDVPTGAVSAFLGQVPPGDLARILVELS